LFFSFDAARSDYADGDVTLMPIGTGRKPSHEITVKIRTGIAMLKWLFTHAVGRLPIVCLVAATGLGSADAADDPITATRVQLERIQSL
jgi:hypothetical protein